MYCKNCGAEYEDNLAECPYCGAENYKKSVEEHQKVIVDYQEKTQRIQMLPQRISWKAVKIAAIILVLFFVMLNIYISNAGKEQAIESEHEYQERVDTLAELEELYQAGQYLELYQMWKDGRYENSKGQFMKYWRVGDLANVYERCLDGVEDDIEHARNADGLSVIGYCIKGMTSCKEYEGEDYPYGEEVGVIYYYDKSMEFLKDYFLLTEEEIEQGIDYYMVEEELPTYLYEISYERLKIQGE